MSLVRQKPGLTILGAVSSCIDENISCRLNAGMRAPGGSVDEPLLQRQDHAQAPTQSGSAYTSMDLAGDLEPFFIPGKQAPLQHGVTTLPTPLWYLCGQPVGSTDVVHFALYIKQYHVHMKNFALAILLTMFPMRWISRALPFKIG